jgi:hypothetical protein
MTKGRKIYMIQIRGILHRLRSKQSQRSINRDIGVDRSIIREINDLAIAHNWLNDSAPMPTDEEIAKVWKPKQSKQYHPLDNHYADIKSWHSSGHSAVVIKNLLTDKCPCDVQVIRRYLRKNFPKPIDPIMVRTTIPGEYMDIDFGCLGLFLDKEGKEKKVSIFSARLRHSRRAYREIVVDQKLPTLLTCLIRAFEYFNGVPKNVVLDNMKAAITKSTKDNDMVNRSLQDLAEHYGFVISPCLPRTPQHKGGVERDMSYVKQNYMPIFLERQKECGIKKPTIDDLSEELKKWQRTVDDLHIVHGVGRSPLEIFKTDEEKTLSPLPENRWEVTEWGQSVVRRDWRIMYDTAYYSVPFQLIGKTVQVCKTSTCVRIFYEHKEVAYHEVAKEKWEYKRKTEHAPPIQEEVLGCTRESLLLQAELVGPFTYQVVNQILSHPSIDKLRPIRSLLLLGKKYSQVRLENACQRASTYKMFSYRNIKTILEKDLDSQPNEVSNRSKVVSMPNYRFNRNSQDYKSEKVSQKETFNEKCDRMHPISKYGNAMVRGFNSIMADQIMEEMEKNEK